MAGSNATNQESPYCRIENVLAESQNRRLFDSICRNASRFERSTTTTREPNFRKSLVLYSLPQFFPVFAELIEICMPFVIRTLGKRVFEVRDVELQVTAHNDGDFFKTHTDNGSGKTRRRSISFVYYLHRLPKPFRGGELILYGSSGRGQIQTIEPLNNSILFFRSERSHAVGPVRCPSKKFEDSRFTVNGWVCR